MAAAHKHAENHPPREKKEVKKSETLSARGIQKETLSSYTYEQRISVVLGGGRQFPVTSSSLTMNACTRSILSSSMVFLPTMKNLRGGFIVSRTSSSSDNVDLTKISSSSSSGDILAEVSIVHTHARVRTPVRKRERETASAFARESEEEREL